ncbi:MAG TPA: signal peptidase II [Planctomycetota bacterium]|nr:signal peptidase II [Planctomycetota bacterium]
MQEEERKRGFGGKAFFFAVAALGTVADLVTKAMVFGFLGRRHGEPYTVIPGFFYLDNVENPGGVFGLGKGLTVPLAVARGVALLVILAFVRGTPRTERLQHLCLGFLFAGALGNLYDNLTNAGQVRDWLDFYLLGGDRGHFPTFNVADSMICVGAFLLLAQGLFARRSPGPSAARSGA